MSIARLRNAARANHNWVTLRRIQREGITNAFRRWNLWSRILTTRPVAVAEAPRKKDVEVHLLCCERDYLSAIWALKSFYAFAELRLPLTIHFQGHHTATVLRRLAEHFPGARVLTQAEADRTVHAKLDSFGLNRLLAARDASPFMLKFTDFLLMCRTERILILDSDLLFFAPPSELVDSIANEDSSWWFMRDPVSVYNISEMQARQFLNIELAPRINTGIALINCEAVNLARCEVYLKHPAIARPTGWIEQTLYALCASENTYPHYLPDSYLVSLEPNLPFDGIVARHYAGPSRPLLTSEGMPRLVSSGWLSKMAGC